MGKAKKIEITNFLLIWVTLFFVSYNRAQQQVHSFDQLLDGFVMGILFSNFLLEP
jgi:hypothetical protein